MRVKLDIIQGQREWHAGHACILPAARYHGVSVEDLPSDCIDFRLWNGREIEFLPAPLCFLTLLSPELLKPLLRLYGFFTVS